MLAADGHVPVSFDNLSTAHADLVQWGPLARGHILDPESLDEAFRQYRSVAVICFAGLAYVGESFSEPLRYYKTNAAGMVNLLEAMVRDGVGKIIFSSSCTTYGIPDSLPISEDAPQRPISPYGRSRLM
jgi:UDP-arabinose 4-epimerase